MNYYQVPMLSNSQLGELDRMQNEKFRPSEEILQRAFQVGNQIDYSLFEPQNVDKDDPNLPNILKMKEAVMEHSLFKAYYNHPECKHQHEVYRIISGIPFKCKLDSYLKRFKLKVFKPISYPPSLSPQLKGMLDNGVEFFWA